MLRRGTASTCSRYARTTPSYKLDNHVDNTLFISNPTIQFLIAMTFLQYQKLYFSETPGTKEMRSGCLFSCNMCGEFTGTHEDEFKRHLRRHHDTSLEEYSKKNRTSVHAKSLVRCVFCDSDRPIRHSAIYLKAHSRDSYDLFPAFLAFQDGVCGIF